MRLHLTSAFGLLLTARVASAQQGADTVQLNPVVVTATRLAGPLPASPTANTLIDGEDLRRRGVATVADALRDVPGAAVVGGGSFGGTTSLFLRGGESDFVKVLIDGVPVNEPGGRFDFASLGTDNIERIEIVRGPASVLYGSDAVAGVIQIFTREGRGPSRLDLAARAGSYRTREVDGAIAGGGTAAGYSLGGGLHTTDGLLPWNNRHRSGVWSGLLRAGSAGRGDARLSARYSDGRFHFPTDGGGALTDSNQYTRDRLLSAGLEAGRPFGARLEARALLGVASLDRAFRDAPDGPGDTLGFFAASGDTRQLRRAAEARANVHLPHRVIATLGAALEWTRERSTFSSRSEFGTFDDRFEAARRNRAYYAQLVAPLAGRGALSGGVRLEENERFGSHVTWRAGGSAAAWPGAHVRAGVGTSFKEPTFFEQYATGFVQGNPDLDPERSTSREAGIDQRLGGGRAMLSATWFDQRFAGMIQYAPTSDPSAPDYFNLARATARGTELALRLALARALSVTSSYTWLDTRVTDPGADTGPSATFVRGERLIRRPRHQATLAATWVAARGSLDARLRYAGARDDRDFSSFPPRPVRLGGYSTVDVSGQIALLAATGRRPGLALTARVENLLDREYEEVANFSAPARRVLLGGRILLSR